MAEKTYAYIKNNTVVNLAVFEYPITQELLTSFLEHFSLDAIVLADEATETTKATSIGDTYDGTNFLPNS